MVVAKPRDDGAVRRAVDRADIGNHFCAIADGATRFSLRSIDVFQNLADFEPLMPSEKGLLANIGGGIFHRCGDGGLPAIDDASCHIRAEFLRLVLLGGHGLPDARKGLLVSGAWVTGNP